MARAKKNAASAPVRASPEVGTSLRRLRTELGLSLEKLAQAAGVSRAMLGQIELGQSTPTIKTLWKIAGALEVPFSALLGDRAASGTKVLRAVKAKRLTSADGSFVSRALFPIGEQQRAEFYELSIAAGAVEIADPHAAGTHENLVVSNGKVEIEVGGEKHTLGQDDAIVFDASGPHAYRNVGKGTATMYLVITYAQRA